MHSRGLYVVFGEIPCLLEQMDQEGGNEIGGNEKRVDQEYHLSLTDVWM
jgi:hypothetical protein